VLVFTKSAGTRRPSIQDGVNIIRNLGQNVFLNTTGDVLNAAQEAAFEGPGAADRAVLLGGLVRSRPR
jgi:hypothetical protein